MTLDEARNKWSKSLTNEAPEASSYQSAKIGGSFCEGEK
jgi:hypothetical protein